MAQHICVDCGVPPARPSDAPLSDSDAALCPKCSKPLQRPTVFDCARLGLLDELKELIDQVQIAIL